MVAVRLDDAALAYAGAKLDEAGGGIAAHLQRAALWEPVVLVPDFADPLTLPELDYGGVAGQQGSDAELASYLMFLKKRDGRLRSVIFDDPWAQPGDLDYAGPPPDTLLALQGRVSYLHDLTEISPELVWDYRSIAVSYFKFVYVCDAAPDDIRALAEEAPDDIFHRLARSVRHVAMSAYDDETWLILRHEKAAQPAAGKGDCKGDCDGDCGGDCGEAGCGDPDCHCHHDGND